MFYTCIGISLVNAQGTWTTINTTNTGSNGLMANWITDIAEDTLGNMWISNSSGLSKFDGSSWTNYLPFDSTNYAGIGDVAVDGANNVWVGSGYLGGVSVFDGDTWNLYTTDSGLINNSIIDICTDDTTIWIGTYSGISKYDGIDFTDLIIGDSVETIVFDPYTGQFDTIIEFKAFAIRALAVDTEHNLWAAAFRFDGSVYTGLLKKYDGTDWTGYTPADGLIDSLITCIAVDHLGNLWFGSESGVSKYDQSTFTNYTTADGLISDSVYTITCDNTGAIWFGSHKGVSKFEGNSWTDVRKSDGLVSNLITNIFTDIDNNVWIGTRYGVSMYDGESFVNISTFDGLINNNIRGVKGSNNGIWIGTERGASFFNGEDWHGYAMVNGLGGDYVEVAFDDSNGNNWFGIINAPLTMLNGINDTIYSSLFGHVCAIREEDSGKLWFGNAYGLYNYDGSIWTYMDTDTLEPYGVKSVTLDNMGNVWAGFAYGVIGKYNGTTWEMDTLGEGIYNNHVSSIVFDSSGNIWANAGNLYKHNGNDWIKIDSTHGFMQNYVSNIAIDELNNLWFSTFDGVTCYDGYNFTNYTTDDGLVFNRIGELGVDNFNNKWFGSGFYGLSKYCEDMSVEGCITYNDTIVSNGEVFLYRYHENSGLELSGSTSIDTNGNYQFTLTETGYYTLSAIGDNLVYPGTFETYYNTEYDPCNGIELLEFHCADSFNNINIYLGDSSDIMHADFSRIDNGDGNYTFINNSTGGFNLSHWAFGDGTLSYDINPDHSFLANGVYVVVLTVMDSAVGSSCTDHYLDTVYVTGVPVGLQCSAGFVIYPDTINNTVIIVNSSIGNNLSSIWDFGDGNTSTLQYPYHEYETNGPFYICLSIDDGNSCTDMYCDSIGADGIVYRQEGFYINVVPPEPTGTNNNDMTSEVLIYPNPAFDRISVVSNLKIDEIVISGIRGNSIKTIYSGFNSINIEDLPPGYYLINCSIDNKQIKSKLIKR